MSELTRGEIVWHPFSSRDEVAQALSSDIEQRLNAAIAQHSAGSIAFSGGSTPKPLFNALKGSNIDWASTLVTLVDERAVPISDALSNWAMLERELLAGLPKRPDGAPLYVGGDVQLDETAVLDSLQNVAAEYSGARNASTSRYRFDIAVLGMGGDGHTASFFPDADNVGDLVQYREDTVLQTCQSPNSQVLRITWSLAALLDSEYLVLHITGQDKRDLFEAATESPSASIDQLKEWPIRAMAYQQHRPLNVYYAD